MVKETRDQIVTKKLAKVTELDNKIRGNYLVAASYLEHNMNEAIASHFYPNPRSGDQKRLDLLWFILSNHSLGFRVKVAIYASLIKKRYPELWEKYQNEILKLEGVAKFRNMLAHAGSVLPDEDLSKVDVDYISLVDFKIGQPVHHKITQKEGEAKMAEVDRLYDITGEIWRAIWKQNDPDTYRKGLRKRYGAIN